MKKRGHKNQSKIYPIFTTHCAHENSYLLCLRTGFVCIPVVTTSLIIQRSRRAAGEPHWGGEGRRKEGRKTATRGEIGGKPKS